YNLFITLNYIVNINVQFYTSINTIFNYVAKYVYKAEKRTKSYNEIANELIPHINTRNLVK
ncbi:hypothetical protein QBC45DRAFT_339061, partial [Copromyces sp. CBS 386.78]